MTLTLSPEVRNEKNTRNSNGVRFEVVINPPEKFMIGAPSYKKGFMILKPDTK